MHFVGVCSQALSLALLLSSEKKRPFLKSLLYGA